MSGHRLDVRRVERSSYFLAPRGDECGVGRVEVDSDGVAAVELSHEAGCECAGERIEDDAGPEMVGDVLDVIRPAVRAGQLTLNSVKQ